MSNVMLKNRIEEIVLRSLCHGKNGLNELKEKLFFLPTETLSRTLQKLHFQEIIKIDHSDVELSFEMFVLIKHLFESNTLYSFNNHKGNIAEDIKEKYGIVVTNEIYKLDLFVK